MAPMETVFEALNHIVKTPDVLGGKPRIAGRRIGVNHIVHWHINEGQTPQEIAESYELDLAAVHAALAYYYDHQEEIDRQMKEEDEAWEAGWQAQQRDPRWQQLKAKLEAARPTHLAQLRALSEED
jgi:uncharacterized protein (DUF433 family)